MKKFFLFTFLISLFSFQLTIGRCQPAFANIPEGYRLMKTYCYICHNPEVKSHDQMLAPPMMAVKKHYKPAMMQQMQGNKNQQSMRMEKSQVELNNGSYQQKRWRKVPHTPAGSYRNV